MATKLFVNSASTKQARPLFVEQGEHGASDRAGQRAEPIHPI
jgi:hypothetical protein